MAAKKKTPTAAPSQSDPQAPLDAAAFLSAAQRVLAVLRDDLLTRADESPGMTEALKAQWEVEKEAQRTGDPWEVWRRRVVVQVAAAWVLSLVFARTLEDRGLLERNRIAGPGATDSQEQFRGIAPYLSDRDYLLTVFGEFSNLPAAKDLFDPAHNPVWKLGPSINGARALLDLFRAPDPEAPAFRFGQADTRFLGDLYQNIDKETQDRFALLQTPHFVESYILDRTLERAIARFGLDDTALIDPTCGSGHFLLGAFERLVDHQLRRGPGLDVREVARRALDAVYGADINPYAVAIARFRLTLAFLDRAGYAQLVDAPALPLHVVVADSLLHNPQHAQAQLGELAGQSMKAWAGNEFSLENEAAAEDVLHRRFAAVVGNPPYITVKDALLRDRYRDLYPTAYKNYSMGVPFTERFFQLARSAGFVGMITANSFTKREFGKRLIEEYLPTLNLDGVINTSGAYIPGHDTPTILLFGTNEPAVGNDILAVLAKRGELSTPADPERGEVWASIVAHGTQVGFENDYVSIALVSRSTLKKHPWSLGGGGAAELKELLEDRAAQTLGDAIDPPIGRAVRVGMDDVYALPAHVSCRIGGDSWRDLLIGEVVRDWGVGPLDKILFPYRATDLKVRDENEPGMLSALRYLWPFRTALARRATFQGIMRDAGLRWYEYMQYTASAYRTPLSIAFASVASHNHFVLDRGGRVFKQSAPVIKLRESASEEDHYSLLAFLNSSTACFWMKQVCYPKATSNKDVGDIRGKEEGNRFDFAGNALLPMPIPEFGPARKRLGLLAAEMLQLAEERDKRGPSLIVRGALEGGVLWRALLENRDRQAQLRESLAARQTEIDWIIYSLFELVPMGCDSTTVQGRGVAREASAHLALLESPVYARPWAGRRGIFGHLVETFEQTALRACGEVFVEAVQGAVAKGSEITTLHGVARQPEVEVVRNRVVEVVDRLGGASTDLFDAALADEAVPFLGAWRHTEVGLEKRAQWVRVWELQRAEDRGEAVPAIETPPKYEQKDYRESTTWRLRGRLDVPKERFISYPGGESDEDGQPIYGWAGWTHLQQAIALATLYLKRKQGEAWGRDRLVPMLAGLDELLPWIWQWHPAPTPESGGAKPGQYIADFLSAQCQELGVTLDEVRAWRPESKGNAAGAAKKTSTRKKSKASAKEETP
jgi:hypothetical protein